MFSGVINNIGIVKKLSSETITIKSSLKPKIGASIAVNGVCVTVIKYKNYEFDAILSKETRDLIALENLNGKVHLEEALKLSDKLDGHIVQGHIDCIGIIKKIQKNQNGFDFTISFDSSKYPLIVPKGSIAIDGISLTINDVNSDTFRLTIIPHTFYETLFHTYKVERRVNIETDILNRSIYHMLKTSNFKKESKWEYIDSILMNY
ncbi:riboflavin synthase [Helicobacter sp. MIT 14-3879]|uniref:riboflavin synthase n=1 Tax=Helicobacter sp. MIT 14-3879 TaxID=2040649 RepID=UPI000E1EF445|nr:riboflavin synthase [Helicobacter sp. MIT 14-3879]RDU64716.1 riboflavin synthase [Helicobacter sp. MIT 14-3879]